MLANRTHCAEVVVLSKHRAKQLFLRAPPHLSPLKRVNLGNPYQPKNIALALATGRAAGTPFGRQRRFACSPKLPWAPTRVRRSLSPQHDLVLRPNNASLLESEHVRRVRVPPVRMRRVHLDA